MSQVIEVKNESQRTIEYTVTIMHGKNDCTENTADIVPFVLEAGGVKQITVAGESIKGVDTDVK